MYNRSLRRPGTRETSRIERCGGTILRYSCIYPVRGVDVSSYQGDIDWEILSEQNIHFAFIKATEGSSFVDEYFETNYLCNRKRL